MTVIQTNQMLNTKEALTLLGVSRSTLYKLMEAGIIQPVSLPSNAVLQRRRLRFHRGDVEKLLEGSNEFQSK